jgi:hypothetical protein
MRRSDLVRIDYKGNVLEGGKIKLINRAAVLIHAASMDSRSMLSKFELILKFQ